MFLSLLIWVLSPFLASRAEPVAYAQPTNLVPHDSSGNSVKIVSITPNTSEPLYAGDTVEIEVALEYALAKSPTIVALNIQRGEISNDRSGVVIASKMEVVNRPKGMIVIKQSIEVPETSSIQVFTPMMTEGEAATTTVDMRSYQVLKRQA